MTIRHVVAWRLSATDPAAKTAHAREMTERLLALQGVVPSLLDISVGSDVVGGANWDIALVAHFADDAALQEYQVHPEHQKVVAFVRDVTADRAAVDFVV